MITAIQFPDEKSFSRNPVVFRFRATDENGDPYAATGARAQLTSTGYVDLAETNTITVQYTDPDGGTQEVIFLVDDTPDSEQDLPGDPTDYTNNEAYYTAIAEKMAAHPLISPFFTVTHPITVAAEKRIVIQAKDTDPGWSVSVTTNNSSFTTSAFDATPSTLPDNYKLLVNLLWEDEYDSGIFRRAFQGEGTPDLNSEITFNLEKILDDLFRTTLSDPPVPAFDASIPQPADVIRRFRLQYREEYEGSPTDWLTWPALEVHLGGIAQNLFADYDFFANLSDTNNFLTYTPSGKTLSLTQPEWLAWYNHESTAQTIVLQVIRYTESGALTTLYAYDDPASQVDPGQVHLLPVGPEQLGFTFTDVLYYDVRIVDETSDWEGGSPAFLSPSRRYYIDSCHHEDERYIMYLNSLGCPETLRCLGDTSEELEVTRQITERILPPDYSSTTAERFQYQYGYEDYFTYRTGYIDAFYADTLKELLILNQAYEVYEEGYIPLVIMDDTFSITSTRQNLHSYEFRSMPALRRKNYSNINIALNPDQEGWRLVPTDYWRTVFGRTWKII